MSRAVKTLISVGVILIVIDSNSNWTGVFVQMSWKVQSSFNQTRCWYNYNTLECWRQHVSEKRLVLIQILTALVSLSLSFSLILLGLFSSCPISRLYSEVQSTLVSAVYAVLIVLCFCRYKVIHFKMTQKVAATPANCVCILNKTGLKKSWVIGRTKVW